MRVLIDTSYSRRGPSGTGVYVEQLVRALRERDAVEVVEAIQPRRLRPGGASPLRSAVNALSTCTGCTGAFPPPPVVPAPIWFTIRCRRAAAAWAAPR